MKKTLNVTLAVEIDAIIDSVDDIVNILSIAFLLTLTNIVKM